jgi:hypothetical protein
VANLSSSVLAAGWPCPAAKFNHMCARARSRGTPSPRSYKDAREICANIAPRSAALRNHLAASEWSCSMPSPQKYATPSSSCALASPCSAAVRYHRAASVPS